MLIYRKSLRRGLFGNSRVWGWVFWVIMGRRALRKLMRSQEKVAVEEIKTGETLILRGVRSRKMPGS